MPLIDLKTNLKDLRFGHDRVGDGSSNQPYIKTSIPDKIGKFGFLNQDFILRGGSNAVTDSALDVVRLGKYFTDPTNPSGLLFIAKQNLLSRTAVRTQTSTGLLNEGVYTPLSTLIQAGGNAFGLHVNKQGLDFFVESGAYSSNTSLYGVKVTPEQSQTDNRLVNLYGAKLLINPNNRFSDPRFINNNISPDRLFLLSYQGGPGSNLGIGPTQIRIASNPVVKSNPFGDIYNPKVNYLTLGYRSLNAGMVTTTSGLNSTPTVTGEEYELNNPRNVKSYTPSSFQQDFRKGLRDVIKDGPKDANGNISTTLMSQAPEYNPAENKTIEQRFNLGDPGNASGKNLFSYTNGSNGNGAASNNSFDKINASLIYQSEGPKGTLDPNHVNNDLVKFRIAVIDNNNPNLKNYIHFRAFLNQISDTYNADWNSTQYIGRGEKFYNYTGFDRKVSLSWTVAAQSKAELIPMYKKLNYLASVCTPDYSGNGYMRGNIVQLTIGGYFYEQPGIITGLSYEMNDDDSSWEIGINDVGDFDDSVKELPHMIKVNSFSFIPIHTFVPRLQQLEFSKASNFDSISYGQERYIALNNGVNNNYTTNFSNLSFTSPLPTDSNLEGL